MRNATSFTVKQKVELLEVITGIETANRYTISDQMGRKILYATEEPNCLGANVCGKCRSFDIRVRDINNTPLLNLKRGLDCGCCFGCIAPDKLIVSTPSGQHLGSVVEQCDILFPRYTVRNESDVTMLKVKGPLLPCSIFSLNAEFRIKSPGGPQVGVIAKKWSGLIGEFFTDADTFTVTFPIDLDVNIKAVCLGLLFLIVSIVATSCYLTEPKLNANLEIQTGIRISSTSRVEGAVEILVVADCVVEPKHIAFLPLSPQHRL